MRTIAEMRQQLMSDRSKIIAYLRELKLTVHELGSPSNQSSVEFSIIHLHVKNDLRNVPAHIKDAAGRDVDTKMTVRLFDSGAQRNWTANLHQTDIYIHESYKDVQEIADKLLKVFLDMGCLSPEVIAKHRGFKLGIDLGLVESFGKWLNESKGTRFGQEVLDAVKVVLRKASREHKLLPWRWRVVDISSTSRSKRHYLRLEFREPNEKCAEAVEKAVDYVSRKGFMGGKAEDGLRYENDLDPSVPHHLHEGSPYHRLILCVDLCKKGSTKKQFLPDEESSDFSLIVSYDDDADPASSLRYQLNWSSEDSELGDLPLVSLRGLHLAKDLGV